jgi:hypothetical protein
MELDLNKTNGSSPPSRREIVASALEDPAIREAIRRGVRKANVKRYAAVLHIGQILIDGTRGGRNEVRDHVSDFEQATYLTLWEERAEEYAALSPEQRPIFVETLAKRIAWREVYPIKRELPLAEPLDDDLAGSEGDSPQVFACDDISLGRNNWHPNWVSVHASECELIEHIDRQRAQSVPEEQPETEYERRCRLLGARSADWMLDYDNSRYDSAKTSAEKVRYHRLRKKEREAM